MNETMTACFFTFGPDALALVEAVTAFRSAGGKNVAIFDDGMNPLPDSIVETIAPEMRIKTDFKRLNNLLGWPCIFGELDCMELACDRFETDRVLKIDSDTLVLNLEWIDSQSPLCGFHITGEPYIRGMAYSITRECIQGVRKALNDGWRTNSSKVEEDTVITTEALALHGPAVRRINWKEGLAGGWDFGKTPVEKYLKCAVVTFGNRKQINCSCNNEKRERVALEMAKFRKLTSTAGCPPA